MERSRTLRELFSDMFRIGGRNFLKMFALTGPFMGLVALIICLSGASLLGTAQTPPADVAWDGTSTYLFTGAAYLGEIILLFLSAFIGAYNYQIVFSSLGGESISIREGLRRAGRTFLRLVLNGLCLVVLLYAALFLIFLLSVPSLAGAGLAGMLNPWSYSLTGAVVLLWVMWLGLAFAALHFSFVTPHTLYTGRCGFPAIFKSIGIFFRGRYGRNLGHILLLNLCTGVFVYAGMQLMGTGAFFSPEGGVFFWIGAFLMMLAYGAVMQFSVVGNCLVYLSAKHDADAKEAERQADFWNGSGVQ